MIQDSVIYTDGKCRCGRRHSIYPKFKQVFEKWIDKGAQNIADAISAEIQRELITTYKGPIGKGMTYEHIPRGKGIKWSFDK